MQYTTKIERQFKKRKDGFYQEMYYHLVQFTKEKGDIVTKLDKVIPGGVYRRAANSEGSIEGEAMWFDPESGAEIKLIAMRTIDRLPQQ